MKLRFCLRDLLWLTALCAVLVAWWVDDCQISAERSKYRRQVILRDAMRSSDSKPLGEATFIPLDD
jgi:hypothetical protein